VKDGRFVIFHFPFSICHFIAAHLIRAMTNEKWKMENEK